MNKNDFKKFNCGIERESLRINEKGRLSKNPHYNSLGSPLTHPYISTDFAESQIEWNTPPLSSYLSAERFLRDLMIFCLERIGDEFFWPFSMPCSFSKVEIAKYGSSY